MRVRSMVAVPAVLVLVGGSIALGISSPAADPSLSARPALSGVYGTAINADTKANVRVGPSDDGQPTRLAHLFRASTSSQLVSVRFAQRGGTGYSGGTGGSMRISIHADGGSGLPSGTALAVATFVPGNPAGSWSTYRSVSFPSPATLTKGRVYHLVLENTDPAPADNYISVNELFVYGNGLTPLQPRYADGEYAVLTTRHGSWAVEGGHTGVMDLTYADGHHDGLGYIGAMIDRYGVISGPTRMVREQFTVAGRDRAVTAVSVRVRRTGGTSPLTILLESGAGKPIEVVAVPASVVPVSAPGGDNGGAVWVTASFAAPHILTAGATYNLRLSTASDTEYTTFPLLAGTGHGFRSYTFEDGTAQHTATGSTWSSLYPWAPVNLQFYFQ